MEDSTISLMKQPYFLIHDAVNLPHVDDSHFIQLDLENNEYNLKLKKIETVRLGYPFSTCRAYPTGHSHSTCFENSVDKKYQKKLNQAYLQKTTTNYNFTALDSLEPKNFFHVEYLFFAPDNMDIRNECLQICRLDCDEIKYYPGIKGAIKTTLYPDILAYIEVHINEPLTKLITVSSFTLLDYCTYMISMPGAWIGLSVFSLLVEHRQFFSTIIQRSFKSLNCQSSSPGSEDILMTDDVQQFMDHVKSREKETQTSIHRIERKLEQIIHILNDR